MVDDFIQIQCPSCASTEVDSVNPNTYRCRHCSSTFVFRDPRPQAAPPPPPQQYPPPQSQWGPPPQQVGQPVYIVPVHASAGVSAGRWIVWMIVMLVIFGGSGISAFVAFFRGATATATTPTPTTTVQAPKPTPKPAALPLHESKPAAAADPLSESLDPEKPEEPKPAEAPAIDLQEYQALTGCGCRADVEKDGRKDQIDLYLQAGTSSVISSAGTQNFVDTTFAVAGEGLKAFDLPATEETAPATRYPAGRFGIGVGCENDTMVVAAMERVSAWSLSKRELVWSKPLSPAFSRFAEGKASVDCSSITINAGVAHVRTESGMKQFRIDTGDDATTSRPTAPKPTPSTTPKPTPTPTPTPTKPKTEPQKTQPKQKTKPVPPVPPEPEKKRKKGKKTATP